MLLLSKKKLIIPSWFEVYLVDAVSTEMEDGDSCDDAASTETEEAVAERSQSHGLNLAPVLLGAWVGKAVLPQIAQRGVGGFLASLQDQLGVPSYRYLTTLYMSGELAYLDSLSGIVEKLFKDKMFLLWGLVCGATYLLHAASLNRTEGSEAVLSCVEDEALEGKDDEGIADEGEEVVAEGGGGTEQNATQEIDPTYSVEDKTGPAVAVAYPLTVPQVTFKQFLTVAERNKCRLVGKEGRCGDQHRPTAATTTSVPVLRLSSLRDSVPEGDAPVGVVIGKTAKELKTRIGRPVDNVATLSEADPKTLAGEKTFVFIKSPESAPWCSTFLATPTFSLPDAADELFKKMSTSASSASGSNPLLSLPVLKANGPFPPPAEHANSPSLSPRGPAGAYSNDATPPVAPDTARSVEQEFSVANSLNNSLSSV